MRWRTTRLLAGAALLAAAFGCSHGACPPGAPAGALPPLPEVAPGPAAPAASPAPDAALAATEPEPFCVHQGRPDLGAPVHRERGGGGGIARLAECTALRRIEGDDRWLRVAFPEVEGRTEGWIAKRYVMGCEPCRGDDPPGPPQSWPPQPEGMCQALGATGEEALVVAEPADRAEAGGGGRGRAGTRVTVVSYNVWELYDGLGEEAYHTPEAHGGTPRAQYRRRLDAMARLLRPEDADLLVLQEVEGAAVACELASRAWPRSGWSCAATRSRAGRLPQNVGVATRLAATVRELRPRSSREAGPRPALELSIEGADGLTVTGVHLKSSRGRSSHEDCDNARRRMGMAAALARRYEGWSSVLVAGDFNIDPEDPVRAVYDRTDDILEGRGFARLCPNEGCAVPTFPDGRGGGSAIDLAFFRAGGRWGPLSARVLSTPAPGPAARLLSDHLPVVVRLGR